jgi:hypothetical protein
LAEVRQHVRADSPEYDQNLRHSALLYLQQNKPVEAESLLRECLAIRGKKQPGDWGTSSVKSTLGGALAGQNKYAEAEPLLLQGYEELKDREAKIPAHGKIRLVQALERLVQLYDAWGKKDKADEWRKKVPPPKKAVAQVDR